VFGDILIPTFVKKSNNCEHHDAKIENLELFLTKYNF